MKIVLQYVSKAKVTIAGQITGRIDKGYVILAGFSPHDSLDSVNNMVDQIIRLRTIPDKSGKINLPIAAVEGNILIIPQFTLYSDTSRGNRPSFSAAAPPKMAKILFAQFVSLFKTYLPDVQSGEFAAHMQVELINDGPITIILEND